MIFTENWTKQDNDLHRKLNCEKKTHDEIISIMGMEKLKYHPSNKYTAKTSSFVIENIKYHKTEPSISVGFQKITHQYEVLFEIIDSSICQLTFTTTLKLEDATDAQKEEMKKDLIKAISENHTLIKNKISNISYIIKEIDNINFYRELIKNIN